jgi:hypothetical protein
MPITSALQDRSVPLEVRSLPSPRLGRLDSSTIGLEWTEPRSDRAVLENGVAQTGIQVVELALVRVGRMEPEAGGRPGPEEALRRLRR